MINIKSNKGISIIILVITVIILMILSATAIYHINSSNGVGEYNNMVADIELLKDKILIYYNNYDNIPRTNRTINIGGTIYYEIDLQKLDYITLNYGTEYGEEGNLTTNSDVYVVNSSLNIYYLKGIEMSGEMHHEK